MTAKSPSTTAAALAGIAVQTQITAGGTFTPGPAGVYRWR
jgi:hypothetical protein